MSTREGLLLFIILFLITSLTTTDGGCVSSCGDVRNISNPFSLEGDPRNCGNPSYMLTCQENQTLLLNISSKVFLVESISYENQTIRVLDPGLKTDNCSSLPKYSLTSNDFTADYNTYYFAVDPYEISFVTYVSCPYSVDDPSYIKTAPCLKNSSDVYSYVLVGSKEISDLKRLCTTLVTVPSDLSFTDGGGNLSYLSVWRSLRRGFELSFRSILCGDCEAAGGVCRYRFEYNPSPFPYCSNLCSRGALQSIHCFFHYFWIFMQGTGVQILILAGLVMAGRTALGIFCLFAFLIYKVHRRRIAKNSNVERFLEEYRDFTPTRYSYSEIKRITAHFKEKLGHGGFGSVFKGFLASGRPVAIKMLSRSKGNGVDFINEVSTIGRIHHVNVVRLIGFCSEGTKRALIYEYMPNGSLDRFIYTKEGQTSPLSITKKYEIALGTARGIDYLHRGCDMQILHFDIKPHNVLLDANFTPKISDFGLAKLYPVNHSVVSITAAKGTIGYIAPEFIYRKFGRVSYKSDVYSFGRLLLEMTAEMKNMRDTEETSSVEYLPSWIHDQLLRGEDVEMDHDMTSESKIAKMLLVVGLLCIRVRPEDRPSMSRVVEILEGNVEDLQMPSPREFRLFHSEGDTETSQSTEVSESRILLVGDTSDSLSNFHSRE